MAVSFATWGLVSSASQVPTGGVQTVGADTVDTASEQILLEEAVEAPPPPTLETVEPPRVGAPLAVRSDALLPRHRIVAFYGTPASTRMGILGELPPEQMLAKLSEEVGAWQAADPTTPVLPALHVIVSAAAGNPGEGGMYRNRLGDARIQQVVEWAEQSGAIVFLDIQPGRSSVERELPRLRKWLERPDVHLALDPEWNMGPDKLPGRVIGSMSAAEINHAVRYLSELVDSLGLPPKLLVVHRFTRAMVKGALEIESDPNVQVVLHMDGWGPPAQKLDSYRTAVVPEALQFTGFKLFYKNDLKGGSRMLRPDELLALTPLPFYIQYQ